MKDSRRKFLKTIAVGIVGGGVFSGLPTGVLANKDPLSDGFEIQKGYKVFNEVTQKNMVKLAEALVPGSSDIGIKDKVMKVVYADKGAAGVLDAGFWNIDAVSRNRFKKPFYSLENKEDINLLIKHISIRNTRFYNQFRGLVIKIYFSDPAVWKKLSYNGPPQPRGFMDYSEPAKVSADTGGKKNRNGE